MLQGVDLVEAKVGGGAQNASERSQVDAGCYAKGHSLSPIELRFGMAEDTEEYLIEACKETAIEIFTTDL